MNDPLSLWKGIQLCIGAQLAVIGILNLFSKKQSNVILGVICFVISSYFFKTIFWKLIDSNHLFTFVFSGALFCFYGQLLYLYILAIEKKITFKPLAYHFSLPIIIALAYATTRTFYYQIFSDYSLYINLFLLLICTIWISCYFYLGIKKFKQTLNHSLVFKAKRKYQFFYYAINIFLLNMFLSALLIVVSNLVENQFISAINEYYISYFSEFLNIPLYVISSVYLLLFALSQSKNFKSFFLNEQELINKDIIEGKDIIQKRIQAYFYDEKLYLDTNLKIKEAAQKIGVNEKTLSEFLMLEYKMSFKDFVNTLRIDEFKSLLKNTENTQYSLLGLANESGFKSKATFYRVFKKKEGITPNEYLKSL